jgi:glutamine synthetase
MILIPTRHGVDPFRQHKTLMLTASSTTRSPASPTSATPATSPEGRGVPAGTGVADTSYFGPEAEFFIFDDVRFARTSTPAHYFLDSVEGAWNSGRTRAATSGTSPGTRRATSRSRRWTTSRTCARR